MTEAEAMRMIKESCRSGDYEMNGSNLDKIVDEFLRKNGFENLANAINSVDGWRA